ncbi:XRE family transcriptional regulator [Staphylococcus xylosus]|uniref:XRE family transcriptional regulator n=1 Tax=Staphylococcus xylosus TaxID=1288 RepID=UPI002DB9E59E|nr:XRE family transcriptional regulator [Staphylococcus xylosus]MEB6244685.1 XRE family transcriptional regulator [Staphylococcus xylosus]MEB7766100.1 XRE family transcriptional regulator [Staphylococcus xylosus]
MIIETVKKLIESDIIASEIEKATGVDASSIRRIRRGERKLENLSFEKGVALYEYAKIHLDE